MNLKPKEKTQPLEALARANKLRIGGVNQRRELVGAPVKDVVEAIINPPEELASLRLRNLFKKGLIPKFGTVKLEKTFKSLSSRYPLRRQGWNENLRLKDLSEIERRHLARVLIEHAPKEWRSR